MSVVRVTVLHPCTKFEVRRSLYMGKYGALSVSALIGLETLCIDLSTSKWGHGSPVSWASFLPIFSLLRHSILDLWSDRQMNRQTTAINDLCPHTIEAGHNNGYFSHACVFNRTTEYIAYILFCFYCFFCIFAFDF